ncbi:glucose-6-phosphatase 3 isoform X2 [Falco cherrug]|uniref:glucose-6-phosphatase 3 isoform X2 n=1 Tax=Falco cherrug TaxID=345164 RepID=UPI0024795B06|nr:glucose-6-phosphatase 3 isoform X2 [Falco cherrug]
MDALHTTGIHFAEALQSGPPWLEKFWISVTSLADPKCVFTICFPIAYFLDRKVGVSVLWIGLVSEWLNVVLKWFLFGERPFWWVHESGLTSKQLLTLRQFPVSCETGPGSPSGHCMITGAALWPLVTALTELASRQSRSLVVKLAPFGAYTLLLLAVGLSRVFILAHFPHQVVCGTLAEPQPACPHHPGAALGWGLQARTLATRTPGFFVAAALALLLSSLALHSMVIAAGIDIDWFRKGDTEPQHSHLLPPGAPPKCSGAPPGIARNSFIYTRTNIGNILQNTQLKTISRARERASDRQKRNRGRAGGEQGRGTQTPAQSKTASLPGGRHPSPPPPGRWLVSR